LTAGLGLVGGAMQQSAADSRAEKQYQNDMEAARLQRQWQLEDRDEARTYSRQVLGQLVTDAEAAGFNPLSVLRNGGASNYNAAAGFAPLSRQAPVKQEAGDYMGAAVANAGQSVGDFLKDFDPFRDNKREQESRLIESQIASLNASTLSGVKHGRGNFASGDFDVNPRRKVAALSGASRSTAGKNAPGEGTIVGGDDPKVSSMGWNDKKSGWFHAPWMPDADTVENIYGDSEVLSMAYGLGKLAIDGAYSGYKNFVRGPLDNAAKTKVDAKYRKEYFDNIRSSVPSLSRPR